MKNQSAEQLYAFIKSLIDLDSLLEEMEIIREPPCTLQRDEYGKIWIGLTSVPVRDQRSYEEVFGVSAIVHERYGSFVDLVLVVPTYIF